MATKTKSLRKRRKRALTPESLGLGLDVIQSYENNARQCTFALVRFLAMERDVERAQKRSRDAWTWLSKVHDLVSDVEQYARLKSFRTMEYYPEEDERLQAARCLEGEITGVREQLIDFLSARSPEWVEAAFPDEEHRVFRAHLARFRAVRLGFVETEYDPMPRPSEIPFIKCWDDAGELVAAMRRSRIEDGASTQEVSSAENDERLLFLFAEQIKIRRRLDQAFDTENDVGPIRRALFDHRLSHEALEAMMTIVKASRERAWESQQECESAGTAELRASEWKLDLEDALDLVSRSHATLHRDLADLVPAIRRAGVLEIGDGGRDAGNGCHVSFRLAKKHLIRLGRFGGSIQDARVLAHEIGHAVQNRELGDWAFVEEARSPTLGETFAIFFELLLLRQIELEGGDSSRQAVQKLRALMTRDYLFDFPMAVDLELSAHRLHGEDGPGEDALKALIGDVHDTWSGHARTTIRQHWWHMLFGLPKPFYRMSYVAGFLLAHALHGSWVSEGEGMFSRLRDLIDFSRTETLDQAFLDAFGFRMDRRDFWQRSIDLAHGCQGR